MGPQPGQHSFVRRHRTPLIVAAAVVILGGAGAGIAVAATTGDSSSTASPNGSTSSVPGEGQQVSGSAAAAGNGKQAKKAKKAKKGQAGQRPTRATIVSEGSTSWTVRTRQGKTVTITITPQTQFGTKKAPASRTQFTVGKQIAVIGQQSGTGITATRIRVPQQQKAPAGAPATPSSSPS